MKIKILAPIALVAIAALPLYFSCKKDNHPTPPPTDSTGIVDLKKGLLLYLPFSGNFADSSGNHNPTTGVGGAGLTSDQSGAASTALDGAGTGQKVVVTNNGSIKFDTAYTWSMNVMLRSYQRSSFFDMVKDATGDGWVFGVGTAVGATNYLNMNTVDTTGNCSTTVQDYNSQLFTSATALVPGTWYNIVGIFNKGVSQIYINGQLSATLTTPDRHVPVCMSSNLTVGGWWSGDPTSINGKLDEVRLYNRALNTGEIAKLAQGFPVQSNEPVADLKKGLLVYLPFNGSIADSSGNNNPVQIAGTGAGLTYDIHGYANSAFGGSGGSGRVLVTNNGSIQFDTAFSISLSFMERDNTIRQSLCAMVKDEDGKGPSFVMGNSIPGFQNFDFGVAGSLASCDVIGGPSTMTVDTAYSFSPQIESWYNAICTFHKGSLKIYINGKMVAEKIVADQHALLCPDSKLVIGGWWQADPIGLNGKIDNFRLYNRELNSQEIALLSQYYQPTTNSVHTVVSR